MTGFAFAVLVACFAGCGSNTEPAPSNTLAAEPSPPTIEERLVQLATTYREYQHIWNESPTNWDALIEEARAGSGTDSVAALKSLRKAGCKVAWRLAYPSPGETVLATLPDGTSVRIDGVVRRD